MECNLDHASMNRGTNLRSLVSIEFFWKTIAIAISFFQAVLALSGQQGAQQCTTATDAAVGTIADLNCSNTLNKHVKRKNIYFLFFTDWWTLKKREVNGRKVFYIVDKSDYSLHKCSELLITNVCKLLLLQTFFFFPLFSPQVERNSDLGESLRDYCCPNLSATVLLTASFSQA